MSALCLSGGTLQAHTTVIVGLDPSIHGAPQAKRRRTMPPLDASTRALDGQKPAAPANNPPKHTREK